MSKTVYVKSYRQERRYIDLSHWSLLLAVQLSTEYKTFSGCKKTCRAQYDEDKSRRRRFDAAARSRDSADLLGVRVLALPSPDNEEK